METVPRGTANEDSPSHAVKRWSLPLVLAAVLGAVAVLLVVTRDQRATSSVESDAAAAKRPAWSAPLPPESESVALEIDFGNGATRTFARLPWRERMTIGDLMRQASRTAPGLAFTSQGEGKLCLLTSIDGVAGGSADGRFWLYEVNGRPGEVSFEVQSLASGDRVLWAFKGAE